jgi:hypothetical protein
MMSDASDTNQDNMLAPPLSPATIEGQYPGSVYHVVVRTKIGYVAVRRIAEKMFRVRAERFDKMMIFDPTKTDEIRYMASIGLHPAGPNGHRLSAEAYGIDRTRHLIGVLTACLMQKELLFDVFPLQEEEGAVNHQAHIEKQMALVASAIANKPEPAVAPPEETEAFVPIFVKHGKSGPN